MKKLDWDYTNLAKAYVNRPDYSDAAIDAILAIAKPDADAPVLDLGAGAAHLTLKLAERGLNVTALEPNDDMRGQGTARTAHYPDLDWIDGVMENTGLRAGHYAMTTYGSSFSVVDRGETLDESARLLCPGGWFVALFNHRDLDDPLQAEIETLIKDATTGYAYGPRREDQTPHIDASGHFGPVHRLECPIHHDVPKQTWLDAWRSHATLQRQAGARFEEICAAIDARVAQEPGDSLRIPYVTRVWMAQRTR